MLQHDLTLFKIAKVGVEGSNPFARSKFANPGNMMRSILLVGASRGLGNAMAVEFAKRDWNVVATGREGGQSPLHEMARQYPDRVEIETHPCKMARSEPAINLVNRRDLVYVRP